MRFVTAITLSLALASTANAQQARSFDFKGVKATDRYEQHKDAFERCEKYKNFEGCRFKDIMVAGTIVGPQAGWAPDGSLVLIRANFTSVQFSRIAEGFREKWGKPDVYVEQNVQNAYGAKLAIPIATWKFAEGEMTLVGPDFRQNASFEFQTHARKAYIDGLSKPKADF